MQSGPDAFDKLRFVMTFSSNLGVTEILCSFRLVLEEKTGKEIPDSSRLEFLEKFLATNFALSDAEYNTSGPLNRVGIANLPLLRILLAICQTSQESSFYHPNQQKNSHKLCDETGHLVLSLLESQWKLRQQHNHNFPIGGKPL